MDVGAATATTTNSMNHHQQVNKMQRQRLNQQQILSRRKWSDWSECSASCHKTRHRTNCDDLIAQNSTINSNSNPKPPKLAAPPSLSSSAAATAITTSNKPADSYIKRQVAGNNDKSTSLLALSQLGGGQVGEDEGDEDEGELLLKADQVEDDDYADEGDEDNETDSCDNVDPSKTFQKIACSGDLCRPQAAITTTTTTMVSPLDQISLSQGATTVQPGSGAWHHRSNKETRPSKTGRYWDDQQQQHRHMAKGPLEKPTNVATSNGNDGQDNHEGGSSPPELMAGQPTLTTNTAARGKLDHQQGGNIRTRLLNSTGMLTAIKNGNHNYLAGQQQQQPLETTVATRRDEEASETSGGGQEPPVPVGGGGKASAETTSAIWPPSTTTATRNMWPKQLLNPGPDGPLGPQANLIHWTILIGALLTIILLIMLIMRKLFATALPSYHWMLAKQTIKSSSKSRLGSNATTSTDQPPDCYSPVPYPFRGPKPISVGHMGGPNRHMVAPGGGGSSLLIETADYNHKHPKTKGKRPGATSRLPPHHSSYAWRPHHNRQPSTDGLADLPGQAYHGGGAAGCGTGGHFRRFMVDTNGCHLLGFDSTKFNTDQEQQQQEVYIEPFSQVSHSTGGSSQLRRQQPPIPKHTESPDANSVLSANYNTLGSGYYGDSFRHQSVLAAQDQYDKGFMLARDFIPSQRVNGSYHRSMTRKPKAKRRTGGRGAKARQRSSSDASSAHEGVVASEQVVAASAELDCSEEPQYNSASISSTDESPSVQSTTAQLLSHAASSSFEQPPEFEGSLQLVSNLAPRSHESSAAQLASPASLGGGKLRHNKLTCLVTAQTVQSQPNSPMFVGQFNNNRHPPPSTHRLVHRPLQSGPSCSHSTRPLDIREPEYAQPEPQVLNEPSASSSNDNTPNRINGTAPKTRPQTTRLLAAKGLIQTNECDSDDRHYYEEIQNSHTHNTMDN